ncbi:MAG: LysR family transcriptional regulator [Vulcanimicrobiaceae bacterium]
MRETSPSINGLMSLAAVVEHGSFTRAARALGVSQAAVSQQVRDLERGCGLPLVVQHGRVLTTTSLGKELASIGRNISLESRRAAKSVAEHVQGHKGHVTIGASMTIGVYLVPAILARLQKTRPGIHVQIEIANTEVIAQATVDGIVDIGIVEGSVKRPELLTEAFARDELRCIAPRGHALRGRPIVLEQLADETLLLREPGSGSRETLLDGLAARAFAFSRVIEIGNAEAIFGAVCAGLGITWASELAVATHDAATIERLDVEDLYLSRTLRYIRRRDLAPSPAMLAFLELLEADETRQRQLAFAMPK